MGHSKKKPFATVLATLLSADSPSLRLIYDLSDMSPADFDAFKRAWSEAGDERRVALSRHMADIAEENFVVDFSPVFLYLLGDPLPAVRIAALDGLWDAEGSEMAPTIIGLLRDDNNVEVRAAAARSLAHFILLGEWGQIDNRQTPQIIEALLSVYEQPRTPPAVRRAALEAMSSATHPRIAGHIEDAYEDGDNELQLSALFAMGNTADARWLPILEQELGSESAEFRAEAARACGLLGDEAVIDTLEQLLTDDDGEVVAAVIDALGQIGGDRAFNLLSRLADDPAYEDFDEAIDEALEEMEWAGGEFDLFSFADDDEDGAAIDDDYPDDLRLN
jgi:HEAT repeat protein